MKELLYVGKDQDMRKKRGTVVINVENPNGHNNVSSDHNSQLMIGLHSRPVPYTKFHWGRGWVIYQTDTPSNECSFAIFMQVHCFIVCALIPLIYVLSLAFITARVSCFITATVKRRSKVIQLRSVL